MHQVDNTTQCIQFLEVYQMSHIKDVSIMLMKIQEYLETILLVMKFSLHKWHMSVKWLCQIMPQILDKLKSSDQELKFSMNYWVKRVQLNNQEKLLNKFSIGEEECQEVNLQEEFLQLMLDILLELPLDTSGIKIFLLFFGDQPICLMLYHITIDHGREAL